VTRVTSIGPLPCLPWGMPSRSVRRTRLLDGAAVIGLIGPLLVGLYLAPQRPAWMTVCALAALAVAVGAWVLWRRVPRLRRVAVLVFAVSSIALLIAGDGPLAFGGAWLACLLLALTFTGRAAVIYIGVLSAVVTALHLAVGSPVETVIVEVISSAVLAGFGAAFALVVSDGDRVERERERLSAEREDVLARLAAANDELRRRLGSEQDLVLAQERERASRELHDGLGHRLTAVGLSLQFVERAQGRDPERAHAELLRARATVGEALDSMRRLVRAMHPLELGSARGVEAFAAIADAFRSTGLDIRVDVEDDAVEDDDTAGAGELSHEHSLLLVRFVQEGLTNVVRHADAETVHLRVRSHADGIDASIEDSGSGPVAPVTDGFGLRSLRARAETLGGSLDASPTENGFLLRIWLPAADIPAAVDAADGRTTTAVVAA
jgi:signal transduction histidine kinase